jgi:hypothetical protein
LGGLSPDQIPDQGFFPETFALRIWENGVYYNRKSTKDKISMNIHKKKASSEEWEILTESFI